MKKTMIVTGLITGLALASAPAYAQAPAPDTQKVFVNVNFGGQFSDRTIDTALSQTVYDETATVTSSTPTSGGALFDISAGYRVWGDFFVALAVTSFGDKAEADYTATVPNPVFFDRPATSTGHINELKRKETGFHPQIVWAHPLTDKVDLAVSAGPSFVRLSQGVIESFSVPTDSQSAVVSIGEQKGTAKGVHFGADVTYTISPRYGAGAFFRYVNASVDLPSAPDVKTGGVQLGAGVRVRLF